MAGKLAILGGGMAGLSAAFEITSKPDWRERFSEITIYTLGWRVGGKCASGRDVAKRGRNLEHGLHVLGGFYHNTFQVLRPLYEEWRSVGAAPLAFAEAFRPHNCFTLMERRDGGWAQVEVCFPNTAGSPGVDPAPLSLAEMLCRLLVWIRDMMAWHFAEDFASIGEELGGFRLDALEAALGRFEAEAELLACLSADAGAARTLDALSAYQGFLDRAEQAARETSHYHIKNADWIALIGLAVTVARGVIADNVILEGFDSLNDHDAIEWLRRHGASPRVTQSVFVQCGYHYGFAFLGGQPGQENFAAGVALRGLARMFFTYEGALFFHMNGGMGEVVATPLYEVLKARGVQFAFFHKIEELSPSARGDALERIRVSVQAEVKKGPLGYEPLIAFAGRRCWPSAPLYEQLKASVAPGDGEFPSEWDLSDGQGRVRTLIRGADFDIALIALSAESLVRAAKPLASVSPNWEAWLSSLRTAPTLTAQIWYDADNDGLGAPTTGLATTYELPHSTWADMSFLLAYESGASPKAKNLSYFCGPCPCPDPPPQGYADQKTRDWLRQFGRGLLHNLNGDELDYYAFINHDPNDLYTLSPAGSIDKRLRTHEAGFSNVFLAGDCVRTGTDVGAVETAVMSGRQASRALTGSPAYIYGETDFG